MAVSKETVDAACEALKLRGVNPTVELVRRELDGGGSPNAITPLVRSWKDAERARQTAGAASQDDPQTVEPRTLPLPLQRVIEALTTSVATIAPAANAALAEVAETERRRSALDVDAARTAAQAQIEEARKDAADERATTDLVRGEVSEKEAEIAALLQELDGVRKSAKEATDLAAKLERERDEARKEAADAKEEANRLSDRITAFGAAAQAAQKDAAGAHAAKSVIEGENARLREQLIDRDNRLEELGGIKTALAVALEKAENERRRAERAESDFQREREATAELVRLQRPLAEVSHGPAAS